MKSLGMRFVMPFGLLARAFFVLVLLFGSVAVVFRLVVMRRLTAMARHFREIAAGSGSLRSSSQSCGGAISAAESALETVWESERCFRSLVESAPEAIFVQSQGRFVYLNPLMLKLLGASRPEELLGVGFLKFMAPEFHEAIHERIRFQRQTGEPAAPMEMEYVRLDGSRVPVEATAVAIRYQDRDAHLVFVRDIIERKRAEEQLAASEAKYRTLAENVNDIVYSTDLEGRLTYVSPQVAHYGRAPEEMVGHSFLEFVATEDQERLRTEFGRTVETATEFPSEFRIHDKTGQVYWVEDHGKVLRDKAGSIMGVSGVLRDITERKRAQEALLQEKALSDAVINGLPGVFYMFDRQGKMVRWNEEYVRVTGAAPEEAASARVLGRIADCDRERTAAAIERTFTQGQASVEADFVDKDGRRVPFHFAARRLTIADQLYLVGAGHDISERKRAEEELRIAALVDRLTGLPNRALLLDRLQHAILRHQRSGEARYAVLFLDIDRFKNINDSLGHSVGDQLVQKVARRLKDTVRAVDTINREAQGPAAARLGGDEFVILLDGLESSQDACVVAERLLDVLSTPFRFGPHDIVCTASIGIVTSDHGCDRAEDILRDADTAMYEAKLAGRGRYVIFDVSMRQRVQNRLHLENDLRKAIDASQLFLLYQPIVSLETGDPESFEALVRWRHPQRGLISPAEFIPIAEDTSLIVPIGEWVLKEACRQLAQWRQDRGEAAPPSISVNLSRNQLLLPGLPALVERTLKETGLPPSSLHLEITESAVMRDAELATRILNAIKEIGVKLDLDDFGTGYSSLSCLHQFPLDVLKIDRSFVANIERGRDFAALIHAVASLARSLGISVVAEGIETPEQLAVLQSLDCEFGQGYLFAKPLLASEAAVFRVRPGAPRSNTPLEGCVLTSDS